MAFVTKTWKDRLVEYAGRRKLKNVATGEEILMDVSRSEGTVNQAGDAFSAANMNNLEQRIKTEFDSVNSSLTNEVAETFNYGMKDGVRGFYTNPSRADDSFVPFKSIKLLGRFTGTTIDLSSYGDIQNVIPVIKSMRWYEGANCITQNMTQTQSYSFNATTKILTISIGRSYGSWSVTPTVDIYAY